MPQFKKEVQSPTTFLWYQYSHMNAIESFDINKYKNLKKENTIYFYNEMGVLLGIWNAPTEKQCIREVKWRILRIIFLNLLKGGNDPHFPPAAKKEERRREWGNLKKYLQSKIQKYGRCIKR